MTAWWQTGVIYQVYPRSFQDSNGDGIGDLPGIVARLEYLAWLGVDAVWLSPVYPSPMADFGYDVTDYTGIDPMFGTIEDFDRLVSKAHSLGLKIIMDFVPNHTSSQHPWFIESRSSRTNAKRDWYIWRDGKAEGSAPNNWLSEFGGSAWTWDEATNQFYYHAYLDSQPDLNWRTEGVRHAMEDAMHFWLKRGVDGFRLDTIEHLIEDDLLRDNPAVESHDPSQPPTQALRRDYTTDRPEIGEVLRNFRVVTDSYSDRVLIGETYLPLERVVTYYGHGIQLPFNFHLIGAAWNAKTLSALIRRYEALLPTGAWPNWVLGNHDRKRIASRIGPAQAKVAAMLLLTLRGTPTLYYGDELGLCDVVIPPDYLQDPWGKNVPGFGLGRDPVRTPMPWDVSLNAGFCVGQPWLPVNTDYAVRNVAELASDKTSILALYRKLISIRRTSPALTLGDYGATSDQGDVLIFDRFHEGEAVLVALNLSNAPAMVRLPRSGKVIVSTYLDCEDRLISNSFELRANEGVLVALSQ